VLEDVLGQVVVHGIENRVRIGYQPRYRHLLPLRRHVREYEGNLLPRVARAIVLNE
jgi:hypothetical protein